MQSQNYQYFLEWLRNSFNSMQKWDWRAILVCFTVAMTFWIFNSLNDEHTTNLRFPLQFEVVKDNVISLSPPPSYIVVNVSGNGWNLLKRSLSMDVKPEVVRLEDYSKLVGASFFPTQGLLPNIATQLKELNVNYLLQDSIYFHYDTVSSKQVLVSVDTASLSLGKGCRIIPPIITLPNKLTFTGPSTLIESIQDTMVIDLGTDSISSDVNREITVEIPENRMLKVSKNKVNVSFSVIKYDRRRINLGLELVNFPPDSSVTVEPGSASISYLIEADEQYIPQDSLMVLLDYAKLNRSDSTIDPQLIHPKYFSDVRLNPKVFKVYLEPQ